MRLQRSIEVWLVVLWVWGLAWHSVTSLMTASAFYYLEIFFFAGTSWFLLVLRETYLFNLLSLWNNIDVSNNDPEFWRHGSCHQFGWTTRVNTSWISRQLDSFVAWLLIARDGSRTHGCGCPRVSHQIGAGASAEFQQWVYTRPDPYYVGVGAGVDFNPWVTHGARNNSFYFYFYFYKY
jgi:hypothetical protein